MRRFFSGSTSASCIALMVLLVVALMAANPPDKSVVATSPNEEVRLLNLSSDSVNVDALRMMASRVVALWEQDKLIRTRVKIFADHPIVKDALADKTIEITTTAKTPQTILLIPLSHRGNRIIVKRGGLDAIFSLYSLPDNAGIDLEACFKP